MDEPVLSLGSPFVCLLLLLLIPDDEEVFELEPSGRGDVDFDLVLVTLGWSNLEVELVCLELLDIELFEGVEVFEEVGRCCFVVSVSGSPSE